MIKRTLEISREPAHLTIAHRQVVLERGGTTVGSFPCEDLGVVLVEHPGTTYSHAALVSLARDDAVLVVCGRDHLPAAILLPLGDHSEVVSRIHDQIAAGKPLRKRLWRDVVRAKIRGQAANLAAESPARRRLLELAREVRSGDTTNREAQAAKIYWRHWLVDPDHDPGDAAFRRQREGVPPNNLLNYGYAIVRAAIARALVAAGLLPALGIMHSHRANAFCLADDLVEPLRPLVDARVRELHWEGADELDQPTKAALLELLVTPVRTGTTEGPLMVVLHNMTASLVSCFRGESDRLEIPVPCRSADTGACGS